VAETLRSSAKVSVAVLASRVLGVAREMIFGAVFAATWLTDAYVVAFRIPNLLRDLFAEGALSSAFVPTFTEALTKEGKERAYRLGNLVLTGALLVTGVLTLLGIVFAAPITSLMSGDFHGDPARVAMAVRLARIMMPILALISASAVFMGMLNSQQRYTAPAFAPALFNVTCIIAACGLLAVGARGEGAMLIWSVASTAAAAVQALCQLPGLWRLGFRPRLALTGLARDPGVRRILRLMAPACIGLAAVQANVFFNTYFALSLPQEGSATYLQYAFRIFYLPIGMFGVALGVVTTTRVADSAARGDRVALRERTAEGARAVWMLASASAVGLIVLAEPVIGVLFERGAFHAKDTLATAPILQAYMLGVLPYSLVKILAPSFYSLDRPRVPMLASMAAVAANLAFSALTFRTLGARGLALGTTVAALVNFAILRVSFGRMVGPPHRTGWARDLAALAAANAVMAGVVAGLWRLGAAYVLGAGARPRGALAAMLLAVAIGTGFALYAVLLRMLRYPGAEELIALPRRIARRITGKR
jgi:putative peptidoglycan lipid II flippase